METEGKEGEREQNATVKMNPHVITVMKCVSTKHFN